MLALAGGQAGLSSAVNCSSKVSVHIQLGRADVHLQHAAASPEPSIAAGKQLGVVAEPRGVRPQPEGYPL